VGGVCSIVRADVQKCTAASSLLLGETTIMRKLTAWCLAAVAPIAVAGCSGTLLGHFAVLAVAIGIFVGTLSLGKSTPAPALDAPARLDKV
jgi:hypothetical protein